MCGCEAWGHLLSQNSPYWSWCEHTTEVRSIMYDTLSSGHGDLSRDGHKTSGSLSEYSPRSFLSGVRGEECPSLFGGKTEQVLNPKLPVVMLPWPNEERLTVVEENQAELREKKISKIQRDFWEFWVLEFNYPQDELQNNLLGDSVTWVSNQLPPQPLLPKLLFIEFPPPITKNLCVIYSL